MPEGRGAPVICRKGIPLLWRPGRVRIIMIFLPTPREPRARRCRASFLGPPRISAPNQSTIGSHAPHTHTHVPLAYLVTLLVLFASRASVVSHNTFALKLTSNAVYWFSGLFVF